jgi:hypothetical protein
LQSAAECVASAPLDHFDRPAGRDRLIVPSLSGFKTVNPEDTEHDVGGKLKAIHAFARQSARAVERQQQELTVLLGLLHLLPQFFGEAGQVPAHLSSRMSACGSVLDNLPSEPLLADRFQHPFRFDTLRVILDTELVLLQIDFQRRDPRKP